MKETFKETLVPKGWEIVEDVKQTLNNWCAVPKATCLDLNCAHRFSKCCGAEQELFPADENTGSYSCSKCKEYYEYGECNK